MIKLVSYDSRRTFNSRIDYLDARNLDYKKKQHSMSKNLIDLTFEEAEISRWFDTTDISGFSLTDKIRFLYFV